MMGAANRTRGKKIKPQRILIRNTVGARTLALIYIGYLLYLQALGSLIVTELRWRYLNPPPRKVWMFDFIVRT
jgi:hypothetical protein